MEKIFITLLALSLPFITHKAIAIEQSKTIYSKPKNSLERQVFAETNEAGTIEDVLFFLNNDLNIPKPITILMGAKDGPLYDPDKIQIDIPYSFLVGMKEYFLQDYRNEVDEMTPIQASQDVLLHTLFHEIGHALIDLGNLPITGKEEDAVDTLATLLLIEYYDGGTDIALSAAEAFGYESDTIEEFEDQDFWGEHSLDIQRYYSTLCLIYGSTPNDYKDIVDDLGVERAEMCIEDYEIKRNNWFALLKPYLKEQTSNDQSQH